MTNICLFKEYSGLEIPQLPFEFNVDRATEYMGGLKSTESMQIYKTNVKVFESDEGKRTQIIDIFTKAGFIFVTGELISKTKNGIIKCHDRLIFTSPTC